MDKSRIIIGVLAACGVAWWALSNQQQEDVKSDVKSSEILAASLEMVSQVEGYDEDRDRIDALVEQAHEQAFGGTYRQGSLGGRRRSARAASFDADAYSRSLFTHMQMELKAGLNSVGPSQERADLKLMQRLKELRTGLGIKIPGLD